ncbi:MAG: hypothetical protein ABIL37_06620 [candidate division WOR-3 bacterium]
MLELILLFFAKDFESMKAFECCHKKYEKVSKLKYNELKYNESTKSLSFVRETENYRRIFEIKNVEMKKEKNIYILSSKDRKIGKYSEIRYDSDRKTLSFILEKDGERFVRELKAQMDYDKNGKTYTFKIAG